MSHAFEQQPRESNKAFAAFKAYLDLGPERSLEEVAQKFTKSSRLLKRWSAKFGWSDRVRARETYLAGVEREAAEALARGKAAEWLQREQKLRETEWEMHEQAIAAAKKGMAAYMGREKVYANLADIARMLEVASKMGRLATGLDKSNGETADEPQTLRVEVTVALEKIYGGEIVDAEVVAAPSPPQLPAKL